MIRGRAITGIAGATMILLSAGAHSLAGWPAVRERLVAAGAGPELVRDMWVGWNFGGACMLAFAVMLLAGFTAALRGHAWSPVPARVIAFLYVAFGGFALAWTRSPFYVVFVVPGLLLLAASIGGRDHAGAGDARAERAA